LILSGDVNYERRTSSLLQYGFSDYRISIGLRWSPFHNSGTFDQAPSSFSGVGGSGMQNIFTVPGSSY
jgi:hypothetical protein